MKRYILLLTVCLFTCRRAVSTEVPILDTSTGSDTHTALLREPLMKSLVTFLAKTTADDLPCAAAVSRCYHYIQTGEDFLQEHDVMLVAHTLLTRWETVETLIFNELYKAPRPNTQTINNMVVGANNQCCNNLLTAVSSSSSGGGTCDLSEVLAALFTLQTTLMTCCQTTIDNFQSTFTVIADITNTFTICCARLTTDFAGTWTMLSTLQSSTNTCGTFTPITTIPTILSAPGNYCLTQSFTVGANEGGLTITAPRVYVDFNNYSLTLDPGSFFGVQSQADQTTIANGMIVGGLNGAQGTHDIFVATNMTFSGQLNALTVTGTACSISDCTFDTATIGITANNTTALTISNCVMNNVPLGISLQNSLSFFIKNCTMLAPQTTGSQGIGIVSSSNGFVQNCLFQAFYSSGIGIVNGSSNIVVSDCVSNSGAIACFFIQDSTDIALIRCQASAGGNGIQLATENQNLSGIAIHDCIGSSNTANGLICNITPPFTIDTVSIQDCIFSGNTLNGLHLVNTSSSVITNCDFTANGTGCLIDTCFGLGIYHNNASNNTADGFSLITSSACIHRYNEASNNTSYGFAADALSTTCTYYNNLAFNNTVGNFSGIDGIYGIVAPTGDPLSLSSGQPSNQLVYNVETP